MYDSDADIINRIQVFELLSRLTDEERDIIVLWVIEGYTLEEVGVIVGKRYRGRVLRGTAIQYHKDRIMEKLRDMLT